MEEIQQSTTTNNINDPRKRNSGTAEEEPPHKRTTLENTIIVGSLCIAVFLSALDITIVSTSAPTIISAFESAAGSGYQWIVAAFNLPYVAATPSWGKLSDIWGRKPLILAAIIVFLIGSLLCALAHSFAVFVAGRAVQGLGAAGAITLVNICISDLFSLRDRGFYYGLTHFVWAFASAVGPVIGGALTQNASWRWCFWINVPTSGAVFFILLFALRLHTPKTPVLAGLKAVDWIGSLLIVASTLMLLLGLNFGGVTHPWNSAMVICLIVFGLVAGVLFVLSEKYIAKYPVMPLRLFEARSNAGAFALCFFHGMVFLGIAFYLPLYFQAVLGAGPLLSGVYLLPFIVIISVSGAFTGFYIQRTGLYWPPLLIGLAMLTLGTGLMIMLGVEAVWSRIVIFQILSALGCGMLFEPPLLAVQAVVEPRDIATVTATFGFIRSLSTAISVVIGGVVFQNEMLKQREELATAAGENVALLVGGEAAAQLDFIRHLPTAERTVVRHSMTDALRSVWIMYTAFSGAALLAGLVIRSHPLSKENHAPVVGLSEEQESSAREEK